MCFSLPTTCNLTYWKVSQQTYVHHHQEMASLGVVIGQNSAEAGVGGALIGNWVWPKGEIHNFSVAETGWRGKKERDF